jgi:quercetin dioxygenase-like cupin family protein
VTTAAELRRALADEGLSASSWANGPGDRYAAHAHAYDKVLVCATGSITFRLADGDGEGVTLRPGERLELPAGTLHAAEVGPDGVECLEAHLPAGALGAR